MNRPFHVVEVVTFHSYNEALGASDLNSNAGFKTQAEIATELNEKTTAAAAGRELHCVGVTQEHGHILVFFREMEGRRPNRSSIPHPNPPESSRVYR